MMVYQALDTIKIGDTVYDIMATSNRLFDPAEDVGIRPIPWRWCSRGYVVDFVLHEDRLFVMDLCLGTFDCGLVVTSRMEVEQPQIDGKVADVDGGIASWLGLYRDHRYTGAMVIGIGDETEEWGLGCYRSGSTSFRDCRELYFRGGVLVSNEACELERMYTLQNPGDLLQSLVGGCRTGEGLLCALTHGIVPMDLKKSFAHTLIKPAHGDEEEITLHTALAEMVEQRIELAPDEHPFGLLLDELRRIRVGPGQDVSMLPWTLPHILLHKSYADNQILHQFEELLKPGLSWEISKVNFCPVRGESDVCPDACLFEMKLERLRQSGSQVLTRNYLQYVFPSAVPANCRCLLQGAER